MEGISESSRIWKRPDFIPFPMIWHRFVGHLEDKRLPIKIQDIPPDRFDEVLDFMASEFDKKEPISACPTSAVLLKRENVQAALRNMRRKILEQRVSLMAVLENEDQKPEMVGCALLVVNQETKPFLVDKIEEYYQVMEIVRLVRRRVNIKQLFRQKPFVEDSGLCVASKFYGMDTGYRLLVALENMASTLGIAGAAMTFSSKYSQKCADKANFMLLNELKYDDFKDKNGQKKLPVVDTQSIKFMYVIYCNKESYRTD